MPPIDGAVANITSSNTNAAPTTSHRKDVHSRKPSTTFHLLAGLGSGFTSSILLQPADLLKTRVQQSRSHSLLGTLRLIASQPQPIKQLWRGTLPSVIRTSIGSALYFTTLNALRTNVAKGGAMAVVPTTLLSKTGQSTSATAASSSALPQLSPLGNLACGAFARASVGFIMMPITVIKVRYESSYYSYQSIVGAARDIGSKEGLRGFFSGFGATAIRDAPYAGLYVVFYEQGKNILSRSAARMSSSVPAATGTTETDAKPVRSETDHNLARLTPGLSASVNFLSSTVAASVATLLTNPPDAIKTRLQLQPQKYRNSLQALKLMLKDEGVRSLFDGLALRMARKAMSSALAWTVYEEFVRRAELKFAVDGV